MNDFSINDLPLISMQDKAPPPFPTSLLSLSDWRWGKKKPKKNPKKKMGGGLYICISLKEDPKERTTQFTTLMPFLCFTNSIVPCTTTASSTLWCGIIIVYFENSTMSENLQIIYIYIYIYSNIFQNIVSFFPSKKILFFL